MSNWITTKELAGGIFGFPQIPIVTQNNLRAKKRIQYTKIGRDVFYKKEWIEDYLNSNIRPAKTEKDVHAS
jgi:hypothetical protein